MAKGIHDERYQTVMHALRSARREAGLSQAELAAKLGKSQQFVSKFEAGERRLDVIEFLDVARALNVAWPDLLELALRT